MTHATFMAAAAAYKGSACLLWPYATNGRGYPRATMFKPKRNVYAHREVCRMAHGEPPTSRHQAAHAVTCTSRACIAGNHLRWATQAENEADKIPQGRTARGENQGRSKLTRADVRAIRADPRAQTEIADSYGVHQSHVSAIKLRRVWIWLP